MAKLSVIAGIPVPIESLGLEAFQPRIKDIAAMGEQPYFSALGLFIKSNKEDFQKVILEEQGELTFDEQRELEMELNINYGTDFLVFQYLANNIDRAKQNIESLLYIVFPKLRSIEWMPRIGIQLGLGDKTVLMDERAFEEFKEVIETVFDYQSESDKEKEYNPANPLANEIVEKIKKAKERRAAQNGSRKNDSESALADICSILSASSNTSLLDIIELTYPQLVIQHERSSLLLSFTNQIRASAFGGLKAEDIIDWTKTL